MSRTARLAITCAALAVAGGIAFTITTGHAQEAPGRFPSTTVDIGIVVSDIEESVAFYRDGLGFTELPGFDVPASLGRESGLADDQPFHVHVLALGDEPTATKVKLMQFTDAPGQPQDNSFIHSTLGLSYLTIHTADTAAAIERASAAGAEPIANCPVELGGGAFLTVVRDPDGNLIEFVGP